MITRTINSRVTSWGASVILFLILSCDSFQEDFIQDEKQVTFNENTYYILPGSSLIIDISTIVTQSFTNASLSISKDPLRGTLTQLDKLLLKYKPAVEFMEGQDQFVFSVSNNSNFLKSDTVTIIMVQNADDLPCTFYAVEDKARVKTGSPSSVSFLKNDRLCGTGSAQVSIQLEPQFGEAMLIGDSVIVYTPGAAFPGRDELVYKLSASSSNDISFGTIVFSNLKIQTLKTPNNLNTIFFVDENTGFLGGGRIYKTLDGAETWSELSAPPFDPFMYCNFNDLFFLDADNGFAAYSSCVDNQFTGGLISTTDGGLSWKKLNFDLPVASVFFTSVTTGFVGVTIVSAQELQVSKIFKTEDGGATWRETFTSPEGTNKSYFWERSGIQFINSNNGYALQSEYTTQEWTESAVNHIFSTSDAGESWTMSTSRRYIRSIALAPENTITAVFGHPYESMPLTSIVRSQDAATWQTTATFPNDIFVHKFSPAGDLGIAVGMSDATLDTLTQVISINKSIDKGASWIEEDLHELLYGLPWDVAVPSNNVAYILCGIGNKFKIIKYTR